MTAFYPLPFCHDCGAGEGCLHLPGCDMEVCPRCLGQLLFDFCWEGEAEPMKQLELEGRIPWLYIKPRCKLCGEHWDSDFTVSDEEWKAMIPPNLQKKILCKQCYEKLKALWKVRGRDGWQVKMVSSKAGGDTNTTP